MILTIIYRYYRAQGIDISDIPFDHCNIPAVQSLVSEAQAAFLFLSNASSNILHYMKIFIMLTPPNSIVDSLDICWLLWYFIRP